MVYFQKPGVAEAELEVDVRRSLRMIHFSLSGSAPEQLFFEPKSSTAGFLDGLIDPQELPRGMTQEDLDYYVAQYQQSGFRGGLNWYRNLDRDIEVTPQLEGEANSAAGAVPCRGKRPSTEVSWDEPRRDARAHPQPAGLCDRPGSWPLGPRRVSRGGE